MKQVVLALALLAVTGCGGSEGPSRWTVTYANCAEQSPPCTRGPMIAAARRADARAAQRIATRDSVLAPLLAGATVTSQSWTTIDGQLLGAALFYRLPRPRPVHAVLPYVAIPPDAPASGECVHPYAQGWLRVDGRKVDALQLLVDLRKAVVVEAAPESGVVAYSWIPGRRHPQCQEND